MDNAQTFQFFNRGPSPKVRLVFFVMLSVLVIFVDAHYRYLESARSAVSVVMAPLQRLASIPGVQIHEAQELLYTQHSLVEYNKSLHKQHVEDSAQLLQFQSLQMENRQLRSLLTLQTRGDLILQTAEIVYAERNVFKRMLLIDKGALANVQPGQVVMDDTGIVGQISHVYPLLSEVMLITEKDHAVPAQVLRNGLRTIVFGAGDTTQLSLRYMPISSDVKEGDILVTSGIDGTYPAGIPVAKVVKIERDPAYPFARVSCLSLAGVDSHRYLMILSGLPKLPEPPPEPVEESKKLKSKHKK